MWLGCVALEINGTVSSYWILEQVDEKQNDCESVNLSACFWRFCCMGVSEMYSVHSPHNWKTVQWYLLETQVSYSSSYKERNVPTASIMYERQMEKFKNLTLKSRFQNVVAT